MNIPLVDLEPYSKPPYVEPLNDAFKRVAYSYRYVKGPEVEAFEQEWAQEVGAVEAVAMSNGTVALEQALRLAGARDQFVLVPALTFVATAEAVVNAGGVPVFVDVDSRGRISQQGLLRAAKQFGDEIAAIVPVHLYGDVFDPGTAFLDSLANTCDATIIMDAAQAHGGLNRDGSPVGSRYICAWSFYPGKNLGAMGDAGAVTIPDMPAGGEYASVLRQMRDHGRTSKYTHKRLGTNARMDELQAAVLRVKLPFLAREIQRRMEAANRYTERLIGHVGIQQPSRELAMRHAWHLYTVRVPAKLRDQILVRLQERGVGAGVHYPDPVCDLPPYTRYPTIGNPSVARTIADATLSLPLHPFLTEEDQDTVGTALIEALEVSRRNA